MISKRHPTQLFQQATVVSTSIKTISTGYVNGSFALFSVQGLECNQTYKSVKIKYWRGSESYLKWTFISEIREIQLVNMIEIFCNLERTLQVKVQFLYMHCIRTWIIKVAALISFWSM